MNFFHAYRVSAQYSMYVLHKKETRAHMCTCCCCFLHRIRLREYTQPPPPPPPRAFTDVGDYTGNTGQTFRHAEPGRVHGGWALVRMGVISGFYGTSPRYPWCANQISGLQFCMLSIVWAKGQPEWTPGAANIQYDAATQQYITSMSL